MLNFLQIKHLRFTLKKVEAIISSGSSTIFFYITIFIIYFYTFVINMDFLLHAVCIFSDLRIILNKNTVTFIKITFIHMPKFKILIVDDDISIIKDIMLTLLKNPDYSILSTGNGKAASEIANNESLDLIIMDWQMPEMNGIEATLLLKESEITKDIPVIITTGIMIDPTNLCTALLSGAVDFLRKPINEIELAARVENMLKLSAAYLTIKQQNKVMQSQLTSRLINIQQLNELKIATIKQLSTIKELSTRSDEKALKESIINTERLLYSKAYTVDWDDFELHLESVHQGFINKLKNKFGDFTRYELRLCAFIKLNMSSKEIASITYTSPNSVNTARKRLKKKLNLHADASLQLFIQNL